MTLTLIMQIFLTIDNNTTFRLKNKDKNPQNESESQFFFSTEIRFFTKSKITLEHEIDEMTKFCDITPEKSLQNFVKFCEFENRGYQNLEKKISAN